MWENRIISADIGVKSREETEGMSNANNSSYQSCEEELSELFLNFPTILDIYTRREKSKSPPPIPTLYFRVGRVGIPSHQV
jgi:hypothetical protein